MSKRGCSATVVMATVNSMLKITQTTASVLPHTAKHALEDIELDIRGLITSMAK